MADPHIPVLLAPLLRAVAPVSGTWLDGTFGAGGYARGLLEAGAGRVIGVDRDPLAFHMAAPWAGEYGDRLRLVEGTFSDLDQLAGESLDGVVLDEERNALGRQRIQHIRDELRAYDRQHAAPPLSKPTRW